MLHRLAVANLADHDHIGRLTQRILQRHLPVQRIHPHLAVRHDAVLVHMHELHRILDRDDVAVTVLVAVADHRRQRRRFARTGRPHHQDQPALGHRQLAHHRRQIQAFQIRNLALDHPQHQPRAPHLRERIHPETTDPPRADRKVQLLVGLELRRLTVVHQRPRQLDRMLRRQRLVRHRHHLAVDLERRRKIHRQEQVRPVLGNHQPQQVIQEGRSLLPLHHRGFLGAGGRTGCRTGRVGSGTHLCTPVA